MQFGMQTLIGIKSLEDCAALCRELGLSFIELNMDMPEYQEDKLCAKDLLRTAGKYGIFYTIHLEGFLDPCVFNKRVSAAYTETALQIIELARILEAPVINMHLNRGDYLTLPNRKVALYGEYEKEYLHKLEAFRDACEHAVEDADIKICVENCGDYGNRPYIVNGLAMLLKSLVFALTLDVGHNATAGYADEPTIMNNIGRLCHMHIHDADSRGNHLPLGDGDVDLTKYLDLAKQHNCRAVIEVKTADGLRQSVAWLINRGYIDG